MSVFLAVTTPFCWSAGVTGKFCRSWSEVMRYCGACATSGYCNLIPGRIDNRRGGADQERAAPLFIRAAAFGQALASSCAATSRARLAAL